MSLQSIKRQKFRISTLQANKQTTIACKIQSKRKIIPLPNFQHLDSYELLKDRVIHLGNLENDCWIKNKTKNRYENQLDQSINRQNMWIFHQYFMSNADKLYFSNNHMCNIIDNVYPQTLLHHTLKFQKFKQLQRVFPIPKLFSRKFIKQLRQQLKNSREIRKNCIQSMKKNLDPETKLIYMPLKAGQQVWAIHPACQHLHPGEVWGQFREESYFIRFRSSKLGTVRVPEIHISTQFLYKNYFPFETSKNSPYLNNLTTYQKYSSPNIPLCQNSGRLIQKITKINQVNFNILCKFTDLIELKSDCITKLRSYNDMFQNKKRNQITITENQIQQYGWVGSLIGLINISLKYSDKAYHILHSKSKERTLLYLKPTQPYISPVKGISLQCLHDEIELVQQKQSSEKEQIQNKQKHDDQIVQGQLGKLLDQFSIKLQQQHYKQLINNCLGLLYEIKTCAKKQKGKLQLKNQRQDQNLNTSQSSYLQKIAKNIEKQDQNLFAQIRNSLIVIMKKLQ